MVILQYIRELSTIIVISCLVTGIPFIVLWKHLHRKYILTASYLTSALLLFIFIDKYLTCSYDQGCSNGNIALLFIPGTLLFFAFGLYSYFYILRFSLLNIRYLLVIGISSLLFGLVGEYWYTLKHLKFLGIYSKEEFFITTLLNAGYFNQYLNRIHFNIFVFFIGIGAVTLLVVNLKLKGEK